MNVLQKLYGNKDREPLFLSPLSCFAIASAVGVVLGYQWYEWFGRQKSFVDLTTVTLVTTYIWTLTALILWEFVQLFPMAHGATLRDATTYAIPLSFLLTFQHLRFYFLGGFGSPRDDLRYLANAGYFLRREAIFYSVIFVALVALLRGMFAHQRISRVEMLSAQMRQELTRLELLNLRSRLQPHFFFNALNTISSFIHERPDEADHLLELLASLLRRNLESADKEFVPLGDEMVAIQDYLDLEQLRFSSRLRYRLDTADDAATVDIPSQVMQPIIENCVVHGVENSSLPTDIIVECRTCDHVVGIKVRNTFCGTSDHKGFGTGLTNVQRRIRLLYGDAATISAGPISGEYQVSLRFPIAKSDSGSAG
jgi:hypothetical protein